MWATSQPMKAATTIAIPPIVGVPCLTMWCSGPWSSLPRIGWPVPARAEERDQEPGAEQRHERRPTAPAIMTAITADLVRCASEQLAARTTPVVEGRRRGRRSSAWSRDPCRRSTTTSPGRASPIASAIAARRSGSTTTVPRSRLVDAADDGVDDRQRVLVTRVVGRDDDTVGEPAPRRRPSAAACRGRGRRRSRTRRSPRPARRPRAPRRAPRPARRACGRSRRSTRERCSPGAVTSSNRPGHRASRRRGRRRRRRGRCRARRPSVSAASEFSTLNAPPSGTTTSRPRHANACRSAVTSRSSASASRVRHRSSISAASSSSRPYGSSMLVTPTPAQLGREQAGLGPEVGLDRPVQVEVVAAEVGEHGDVELGAGDAVQGEGVRRDLHHDRPTPSSTERRRGSRCSSGASGVVRTPRQRARSRRSIARRRAGSRRQVGRRRLAVGAGDADRSRSASAGWPCTAAANGPIARRVSRRRPGRRRAAQPWSTSSAAAPAATAAAAKSWPSRCAAAHAREQRTRARPAASRA